MEFLKNQFIGNSNSADLQIKEAIKLWEQIGGIFPKNDPHNHKSMPWTLSTKSLQACENLIETPAGAVMAEQFVDDYVYRMIRLLLTQQPSGLGPSEVNYIETSVRSALSIFCKLKPEAIVRNIKILAVIFGRDRELCYYYGNKKQFQHYPGHLAFRSQMIRKFAESKGFEKLLEHCFKPHHYLGADIMHNLAAAVVEAYEGRQRVISEALAEAIGVQLMQTLLGTSDEEMKREDTHVLHNFIFEIQALTKVDDFYGFWLQHTEKILSSDNIVMRLFGWDQITEIVKDAEFSAPAAARYIVSDCGYPPVNGVYEYKQDHRDKDGDRSRIYTKTDAPQFSLIRCKMREDCKKWFISEINTRNPGTNDDIDLYQQQHAHPRDQKYLECKPPLRQKEWCTSNPAKNQKHVGVGLGPNLKPDGVLLAAGQSEEDYMVTRVPRWAKSCSLLASVFAAGSVRNEIVGRSKHIIAFLAAHDELVDSDLSIIWKCGMSNPDIVICDSVFQLLAELTYQFSPSLFHTLMRTCHSALEAGDLIKVGTYLEKFVTSGSTVLCNVSKLPETYVKPFIALVWAVRTHAGFDALKNQKLLQELLSTSLSLPDGESIALGHVQECAISLQDITLPPPAATRLVQTLLFLLEKHIKADSIRVLQAEGFADVMLNELQRFVTADESIKLATEVFSQSLRYRLDVLSLFYKASSDVNMPAESVEILWNLLTAARTSNASTTTTTTTSQGADGGSISDVSKTALFKFLESGVSQRSCSTFTDAVSQYVFTTYLCSDAVQWTSSAFSCFHSYFSTFNLPTAVGGGG
jgi:hypothetical protein